jgi:hypothetical protein
MIFQIEKVFSLFLLLSSVQCAQIKLPFEDKFTNKSDYDEELRAMLPKVYYKMGKLEGIMTEAIPDLFEELASEISHGMYGDQDLQELERVCQLSIKRSGGLVRDYYSDFKRQFDPTVTTDFYKEFCKIPGNEELTRKMSKANFYLNELRLCVEVDQFKKKLRQVLPQETDFKEVDYLEYEKIEFEINSKLLQVVTGSWIKSIIIMWNRHPQTRDIIKSHGSFWLNYFDTLDTDVRMREKIFLVQMTGQKEVIMNELNERNSLIRNFFEKKILPSNNEPI